MKDNKDLDHIFILNAKYKESETYLRKIIKELEEYQVEQENLKKEVEKAKLKKEKILKNKEKSWWKFW